MLDDCLFPRRMRSALQWSRPETNVSTAYTLLHGNFSHKKSVTQKCCSSQVSIRDEYTLPAERETPNALVVVWSGTEARHGSRSVTLHRLRLSAYSRDLSQRIPGQPSLTKQKKCCAHHPGIDRLILCCLFSRPAQTSSGSLLSPHFAQFWAITFSTPICELCIGTLS